MACGASAPPRPLASLPWVGMHTEAGRSPSPLEAVTDLKPRHLSFPADHLLPAGPGCPQPQLPPGFWKGQPACRLLPQALPQQEEKDGLSLQGSLAPALGWSQRSACSLFWGSHAPDPAPSPCRGAPVLVRVASGRGSLPFWGICSSYLPSDHRIKAAWLNGNRSTAPKPQAVALLQAGPSPLQLAPAVHVSRPTA